MYVLTLHGHPIATANRWQRLCMAMSAYDAEDQEHMHIASISNVTRLK